MAAPAPSYATPLRQRAVERVWGRRALPSGFERHQTDAAIGEIWYEEADDADLLVKWLFTSERLSIQVHPDDVAARARGLPRGKDEAWVVTDAEPDAVIGLGLRERVSAGALRARAQDGGIEALVDWRPVAAGDVLYSPGGTIHAIGAGVTLIEVQQNLDLTYRLYDYGRPRELHLDEGIAVSDRAPLASQPEPEPRGAGRMILASGRAFVLEHWTMAGPVGLVAHDVPLLLIPRATGGGIDGAALEVGAVWRLPRDGRAELAGPLDLLVAYSGGEVRDAIIAR